MTEELVEKVRHRLRRLKLDAIALVDRGANPGAMIALVKRRDTEEPMDTKQVAEALLSEYVATKKRDGETAEAAYARVVGDPYGSELYSIYSRPDLVDLQATRKAYVGELVAKSVTMDRERERLKAVTAVLELTGRR